MWIWDNPFSDVHDLEVWNNTMYYRRITDFFKYFVGIFIKFGNSE